MTIAESLDISVVGQGRMFHYFWQKNSGNDELMMVKSMRLSEDNTDTAG